MDPIPEYLVASGSLPPGVPADFYARVALLGKNKGAKVIIDVAGKAMKKALEVGYRNQVVGMKKIEFMETWVLVSVTGLGVGELCGEGLRG